MPGSLYTWEHSPTQPPENFLVVDLETTTNPEGRIRAIDGCKPYLVGVRGSIGARSATNCILQLEKETDNIYVNPFKVVVGHNIKFDLEHIARSKCIRIFMDGLDEDLTLTDFMRYLHKKAIVLDTQFITYLHSGHSMQFASLESCCDYWDIPAKKTINLSEELPKVDFDITRIPNLTEYLYNDLEMTTLLINKMLTDPWVISNFSWILKMHEGLLGTFGIEYNGMHVDPSRFVKLSGDVAMKFDALEKELVDLSGCPHFQPASNDHVAAYLFGGSIEIEHREPNGVFASGKKAGQPRFKLVREITTFSGHHTALPVWKSTKTGKFSVNEDVLLSLGTPFTLKLLEYRELAKLKGTYLEGLSKHLRIKDGSYYVFPQINICATATGRTSSSKPNMQNNPTHDSVGVASIYTSRFGPDGILLEVDFKQIEILALAILSGDKQLMDDILHGRDIHAETGRPVFGSAMSKEQRRVIKTINFGLIYGGGAKTLSLQAKVSKSVAQKAIDSFYRRYPGVKEYFDTFKKRIQRLLDTSGHPTGMIHPMGIAQKDVVYTALTGRRYTFRDYFSDTRCTVEVSHTETRNYPVQGFATGDLVLAALGDVWRKVLTKLGDDVKLIGLVHDSLRFDVKLAKLDELVLLLKCTLESAGLSLNKACKRDVWTLPIKVTFSKGTDFFNMEEFEVA